MFDSGMTRLVNLPVWLVMGLALSVGAASVVAETSANPYLGIADRNAFRLRPREGPSIVPVQTPLAQVRIVGITTFGGKQALLQMRLPATSPEPAKELSCILTVGQRKGPVEVLGINEAARTVTVNNSGKVMVLALGKEALRPQTPTSPLQRLPLPIQPTPLR